MADRPGAVLEVHWTPAGLPVWIVPLVGHARPPLSLNDRGLSKGAALKKARIIRGLRGLVATQLLAAGATRVPHVHVVLHYVPRDRRPRDRDNLVATLKPCLDALHRAGRPGSPTAGIVADDTPEFVSWTAPVIHPAEPDAPRLWLEVRGAIKPPADAFGGYGLPLTTPTPEG